MSERVGLFGGSFNPIHNGHLIVARAVAEQVGIDRMMFLPSANPPHKESGRLLAAVHRAEMVKLAIQEEPGFDFSDFDLARTGPTYTLDTVRHFLKSARPGEGIHWIIGADSLAELPTWHRVSELVDECRIITAVRPGWGDVDWSRLGRTFNDDQIKSLRAGVYETPMIDISSTDIRDRVRAGRSIRYLVPESVREHIEHHRLFDDPTKAVHDKCE